MQVEERMKHCATCKEFLDESCFNKNKARHDGLHHICKSCSNAYRKAHKNSICEYSKKYCNENKERIKKLQHDYYIANKERISQRTKKSRVPKREVRLAASRKYYKEHRETLLLRMRLRTHSDRKKINSVNKTKRDSLHDTYIKNRIQVYIKRFGIKIDAKSIPNDLIMAERARIELYRKLKELES